VAPSEEPPTANVEAYADYAQARTFLERRDVKDNLDRSIALFQSAIDAGTPVIPIALRYADRHGNPSRVPAYDGDITMWQSLRTIARAGGLTAELRVLEAIDGARFGRRELSLLCRDRIAWHLGQRNSFSQTGAPGEDEASDIEIVPASR
jgi:hypothetical protein